MSLCVYMSCKGQISLWFSAAKLILFGLHPSHSKHFSFMIEPPILPLGEQPP